MTEERKALTELIEKRADGDLVREMLVFAGERIMEAKVDAQTGSVKVCSAAAQPIRRATAHHRAVRNPPLRGLLYQLRRRRRIKLPYQLGAK